MKTYTMNFGRSLGFKHEHPERTAHRPCDWDITYGVWSNRKAMARSIRMQQSGPPNRRHWTALVPLKDGEGF